MGVKVEKIIEEFKLKSFGQKGWLSNDDLFCPECQRSGKFGIKFTDNSGVAHCFFCDYSASIYSYLKLISRLDLTTNSVEVSINQKIRRLSPEVTSEIITEQIEVKMPIGVKPLLNDEYLNTRGFLPEHYRLFEPCFTNFFSEKKLHDYIIFKIYNKGVLSSWLARSRKSYEWHKENLRKAKLNEEPMVLRYRNSEGTEFDRVLGGYDDITENIETVILVEGLFDKVGVDNKLTLFSDQKIRCCFTFGNKVSDNQINLLREFKNIKMVVLLYDYGTIKQSKTYALKLGKYFNVNVGVPKEEGVDPGDMTVAQFSDLISSLQNPIEFYASNLNMTI